MSVDGCAIFWGSSRWPTPPPLLHPKAEAKGLRGDGCFEALSVDVLRPVRASGSLTAALYPQSLLPPTWGFLDQGVGETVWARALAVAARRKLKGDNETG